MNSKEFVGWAGTNQERFYVFEGDRLVLSSPLMAYGGDTVTATLVWQRL